MTKSHTVLVRVTANAKATLFVLTHLEQSQGIRQYSIGRFNIASKEGDIRIPYNFVKHFHCVGHMPHLLTTVVSVQFRA
jgi:hypothetical protein